MCSSGTYIITRAILFREFSPIFSICKCLDSFWNLHTMLSPEMLALSHRIHFHSTRIPGFVTCPTGIYSYLRSISPSTRVTTPLPVFVSCFIGAQPRPGVCTHSVAALTLQCNLDHVAFIIWSFPEKIRSSHLRALFFQMSFKRSFPVTPSTCS